MKPEPPEERSAPIEPAFGAVPCGQLSIENKERLRLRREKATMEYARGLSYREIARRNGVSFNTVVKDIHSYLQVLAQVYEAPRMRELIATGYRGNLDRLEGLIERVMKEIDSDEEGNVPPLDLEKIETVDKLLANKEKQLSAMAKIYGFAGEMTLNLRPPLNGTAKPGNLLLGGEADKWAREIGADPKRVAKMRAKVRALNAELRHDGSVAAEFTVEGEERIVETPAPGSDESEPESPPEDSDKVEVKGG